MVAYCYPAKRIHSLQIRHCRLTPFTDIAPRFQMSQLSSNCMSTSQHNQTTICSVPQSNTNLWPPNAFLAAAFFMGNTLADRKSAYTEQHESMVSDFWDHYAFFTAEVMSTFIFSRVFWFVYSGVLLRSCSVNAGLQAVQHLSAVKVLA